MKKVKVMLSTLLVLAVLAGALAYKAKSESACLYTTTFTAPTDDPITSIQCEHGPSDNVDLVYTNTAIEFARTLHPDFPCPETTECYRAIWDFEQ